MGRLTLTVLALLLTLTACGAASGEQTIDGITAHDEGGVWVFSHAPTDFMDALHGGVVTIEGGCLLVDGAVVVFHESMLPEAAGLVEAVVEGDEIVVSVPGGGVSLSEGGSRAELPRAVLDRCDVDTVWFGAEGALDISG